MGGRRAFKRTWNSADYLLGWSSALNLSPILKCPLKLTEFGNSARRHRPDSKVCLDIPKAYRRRSPESMPSADRTIECGPLRYRGKGVEGNARWTKNVSSGRRPRLGLVPLRSVCEAAGW